MIAYGTRIHTDPPLTIDLPEDTSASYDIHLIEGVPKEIKTQLSLGYPFLRAQQRYIYLYSDRMPGIREPGQPWCYEIKDIVRFYWLGGERCIYYTVGPAGDAKLLSYWFIHVFLPYFLCVEGMYQFFHASAVEIGNTAHLFMAPSMGGKSTLTDALLTYGAPLIGDDKIPIFSRGDSFMAVPSHPYHRPYRKFEDLGLRAQKLSKTFRPIQHIYILSSVSGTAEPALIPLHGHQKFTALFPHFFHFSSPLRPQRFRFLSEIASNIPISTLEIPWNLKKLENISHLLTRHT